MSPLCFRCDPSFNQVVMAILHLAQQTRVLESQLRTLSASNQPGVKVSQSIQHQSNPTPSIITTHDARHCFQQPSFTGFATVSTAVIFSFHMSDI